MFDNAGRLWVLIVDTEIRLSGANLCPRRWNPRFDTSGFEFLPIKTPRQQQGSSWNGEEAPKVGKRLSQWSRRRPRRCL